MKIVSIVFGGGVSTLGMGIVTTELEMAGYHVENLTPTKENVVAIRDADILLVSLYWFENVLTYMRLLKEFGIRPKSGKQKIVIGGISAINIRVLHGLFDYAVLGDGEVVIADVIRAIEDGSNPASLDGVIQDGDFDTHKELLTAKQIPARAYVELRDNKTARIEMARGCRFKCPFCQLAHTKPYREQPVEIIEHLLKTSKTKSVALFAPDRTGHSGYSRIEALCRRIGKHNTAEDARLDKIVKYKTVNKVKFGIEGFSGETRKRFKKLGKEEQIIDGFDHIFNVLKTPKGKRITTATLYMIGDLPCENKVAVDEFWDLLHRVDEKCHSKFTLFLTLNSFSPKPFTPMERCGINPYNKWSEYWKGRPHLKNMTIASRGGMLGSANRIIHCMTLRGDERLTKALFWLSNDGKKIFLNRSAEAGKAVENFIKKSGVEPESIWGELDDSVVMPHHQFSIQTI